MDLHISYVTGTDDIKAASLFVGRKGSVLRKAMSSGGRRLFLVLCMLILVMLILAIAIPPSPPPKPSPAPSGSMAFLLLPLGFAVVLVLVFIALARARKASYWRYLKEHGGWMTGWGTPSWT